MSEFKRALFMISLIVLSLFVVSCGKDKTTTIPELGVPYKDPTVPPPSVRMDIDGYWLLSKRILITDTKEEVQDDISEESINFLVFKFVNGKSMLSRYPDPNSADQNIGVHYCAQDQNFIFNFDTLLLSIEELGACVSRELQVSALSENSVQFSQRLSNNDILKLVFLRIEQAHYNTILEEKFN